ncbi:MAG: rRNA maturation RNase YbeY [Candidatus Marinimicrobia bacterium]|nr:rRNA maturation RNase YbeY [Candidatus Neomarinimicrobiota bacterium]
MITIQVDSEDNEPPPLQLPVIRSLISTVLGEHKVDDAHIQLVFSTEERLRQLKIDFFHEDAYTDVIAFNLNESHEPLEGEIYISSARARENSVKYEVSHLNELQRLVVHGTLHLLGHEDSSPEARQVMRATEDRILQAASEGPVE